MARPKRIPGRRSGKSENGKKFLLSGACKTVSTQPIHRFSDTCSSSGDGENPKRRKESPQVVSNSCRLQKNASPQRGGTLAGAADKVVLETKLTKVDTIRKKLFDLQKRYYELPPEADEAIEQMETSLEEMEFISLIEDNDGLSNTQKLYYLKSSLTGEAKLIQTTDDTYKSLLKALEDRYENKRAVVDSQILSLINLEKLNYESAEDLRKLLDTVKKNLRTLKTLEYDRNNLSDVLIINLILQKLDKETRKQFEITLKSKEVPDLDNFLTFLENRSLVLEYVNKNVPSKSFSKDQSYHKGFSSNDKQKPKYHQFAKPNKSFGKYFKGGHSLHGFLERETEKPIKSEEMSQTDRHVWNSVWTEIRACGERKFCAEGIEKGKSPP
ncbi:hypothetical protein AVEN_210925-1 [Araneus ventricosus]|uniref:Uncharacterized protein n=1 Tax=Araneus ventricosus TaxID=182803 RepID=A0A4Y2DER8_ARAVE|nr:hypothetical protein AVEN_210925-1 [Araneus ventricosus]